MQEFNPSINEITKLTSACLARIYKQYQALNPDVKADYDKGAAMIAFRLGMDYFFTAREALNAGRLISGGGAVRTALENTADLFFVYDKPDKYPKAYVDSMEQFRAAMVAAASKKADELFESREMRQANQWTNATIDDRVRASGKSLINIYDLLSYFGHPNPGALTYITVKSLNDKQTNLLQQANCLIALTLMGVVLNHSDITEVALEELDAIAKMLGTKLLPDTEEA